MTNSDQIPRRPLAAVLTAASLMFTAMPALAAPGQDADDEEIEAPEGESDVDEQMRERAIVAYQRGTELYNAAKFEEALAAFEEAATLYASPDFQFNIGKCYERLGKYEQAIHHYETYLRTAGDTSDRPVIEASIIDLNKRLDEARAEAEAQAKAEADAKAKAEQDNQLPSGRPLLIAGGALVGVGVAAGLGGGLAFGLQVAGANKTLGDVLSTNPDGLTFAEADEIAQRARFNQTLEIVMIGVGGALAVTGAALLAVGVKRNKARAGQDPSPSARVRVAPTWSRAGAGLLVQGSF